MAADGVTLGVEEEFLIVDRASGELAPRSHELLPAARDRLGDLVTAELNRCQIETASRVCEDLEGLDRQLRQLRRDLDASAAGLGCALLPVAAHPWGSWREQAVELDRERFRAMEARYQVVARQQVICGCHVHVGVADPDLLVAVMTRTRPWLPLLLALSANSPFWEGEDTGYDSYRHEIWERWPTAGVPPALEDWAAYGEVVGELQASGAIEDATHLYWYLRPSVAHPTLEVRVADVCLSVDDAVTLAGLARALVRTGVRELEQDRSGEPPMPEAVLTGAMWRAARYGLDDELVSAVTGRPVPAARAVAELLEHVTPALDELGDRERVGTAVQRILDEGNGAGRQRRAGGRSGDLRKVVALARRALLGADAGTRNRGPGTVLRARTLE
jgi:carboxylate-amine ligase